MFIYSVVVWLMDLGVEVMVRFISIWGEGCDWVRWGCMFVFVGLCCKVFD